MPCEVKGLASLSLLVHVLEMLNKCYYFTAFVLQT